METIQTAVARMREQGFTLESKDGRLIVGGKELTEQQRQWVRANRDRILAEVAATEALKARARERLRSVLTSLLEDAMDWYVEDLALIAEMGDAELTATVLDYMGARDHYRRGLRETPGPDRL